MAELVAIDTDGTLLGPDGYISVRNAHVIWCMQNAGVELLVCTGRSCAGTLPPLGEAGSKVAVVCMNRMFVYDWKGRLIHKQEFARFQVEHILECCRDEDVIFDSMTDRGSCTAVGEGGFRECFERDTLLSMAEYSCGNIRRRFTLIPPGELLCRELGLYKASVIYESRQVLEQIKERLKTVEDLAMASSFIINLEPIHTEAQKSKALVAYAFMKNIWLSQVMAIGDSENDYSTLSMNLKYTIAMGNVMERMKNITKYQIRTNAQDGVVYAIKNLVPYKKAGGVWRNMGKIDPMH